MRRLVDDLLWLARFDALQGRPPGGARRPRASWPCRPSTASLPVAEQRHLALHVAVPPQASVVQAPADWLDRLLGVLMDNACKYSPDGGDVAVTVTPGERTCAAHRGRRRAGHPAG